ncbi:uncharacterized protein LOC123686041 [Harmonia axyridis]|uniref:uncharacterized protein LOC123686041 n=1 Tax=Harmonia axyridis TaxID=115357 RepID=UPI001E2786A5|nr:uncharacterized protein LOC123686041 [Harmonia axyridis]
MWIQQILVAVLCITCTVHQTRAVVNKATFQDSAVNNVNSNTNEDAKSGEADTATAESNHEANKRDAPVLSDSYGVPISPGSLNSYGPPPLPAPVYGVPNHPSNNIVYPPPPPDIPPPVSTSFVNSNNLDLPSGSYGVPNGRPGIPFEKYGPPNSISADFGPPPPPPIKYGPPKLPKPFISKPFKPRPAYGPPKPLFTPKGPKPIYGPPKYYRKPKPSYGPPKLTYGPPGINLGPSYFNNGPPKNVYGPPKYVISSPHNHYGPPDPVPHPPPPGVPAPPTPPEIKYDGWKPIPGLVSRPPSDSYGVPHGQPHSSGDLLLNIDFTPPPVGGNGDNHISIESHSNVNLFGSSNNGGVRDSYGAPLNAVTGSGQIITSAVPTNDHHGDIKLGLSAVGVNSGQNDNLAVIKSIGYEILQQSNGQYYVNNNGGAHSNSQYHVNNNGGSQSNSQFYVNNNGGAQSSSLNGHDIHSDSLSGGISNAFLSGGDIKFEGALNNNYLPPQSGNIILDTYSAPPSDSYSISGPYAAAHSYKSSGLSSSKFNSFKQFKKYPSYKPEGGLSNSATHGGLVPPSGYYGIPPSGQYGTPLIDTGSFLNALEINPPQRPVVHREPVPHGVLQSLDGRGHHHKDAKGLVHNIHLAQSSHNNQFNAASTYIPPPVSDNIKPVNENIPHISTDLSLPSTHTHTTFRDNSVAQSDSYSHALNIQGVQSAALTGYQLPSTGVATSYQSSSNYQAPVNAVEGLYGVPVTSFGIVQDSSHSDSSHGINIALAHNQGLYPFGYAGIPHDCSAYKSQPLPEITYGTPQQNGYSSSLSQVSNIGGNYQGQIIQGTYGVPDLQSAHSQIVASDQTGNNIDINDKESFAKSLVPGAEVIPSQSIDFHSVPIQVPNTYSVQIQNSENTHSDISSGQYLNDALLQSVLNAVEQTKTNEQNARSNLQVVATGPGAVHQHLDLDTQHSIRNEVYTTSNALNGTSSQSEEPDSLPDENPLSLIGNEEIALYFNKNIGQDLRANENVENKDTKSSQYDNFGFQQESHSLQSQNNTTEIV